MSRSHSDYTVACICPMGVELTPVRGMLDEIHPPLPVARDQNAYILGEIGQHKVVVAVMPETGNNAAAVVATQLANDFPAVRLALLVGIGGGIPGDEGDDEQDIRLGDVVVSQTVGQFGGVVQYDLGKWLSDGTFERTGHLNKAPSILRSTVQMLRAQHDMEPSQMTGYLSEMMQRYPKMRGKYSMPDTTTSPDKLFRTTYTHQSGKTCIQCDMTQIRRRPDRTSQEPCIHYGTIGSANAVVKDAVLRDNLRDDMQLLCVEMEAAGIMDSFPCLVIRGICDYADSHKNKAWQPYAAAVAAAYMKELLMNLPALSMSQMASVKETLVTVYALSSLCSLNMRHIPYMQKDQTFMDSSADRVTDVQTHQLLDQSVKLQATMLHHAQAQPQIQETRYRTEQEERCHQLFKTTDYERQKDRNSDRVEGTCQWVLKHPFFRKWHDDKQGPLLWISADPGCGKSVLVKSLVDSELKDTDNSATICYFFFKDSEEQDDLSVALCAILHQLFTQQSHLLRHASDSHKKNGDRIREESQTLWQILQMASTDPSARPMTCIFDALDECREMDRHQLISWLCDFHQQGSHSPSVPQRLKFLVTSRPYDSVSRWFGDLPEETPQIRLRGEDENDQIQQEISLVVNHKVDKLAAEFRLTPSTQERLREELHRMQHRTYLWLYLSSETIRDAFRNSLDPDTVKIDNVLAKDVRDAYKRILQRVRPEHEPYVRNILLIIVGARRALSIDEMAVALSIRLQLSGFSPHKVNRNHLERHVRDWCRLFVFVNHSRLYLIHQTAKEFLLTNEYKAELGSDANLNKGWNWPLSKSVVEREMARICIEHLHSTPSMSDAESATTFFRYCAEHWLWHFEDDNIAADERLLDQVLRLYDTHALLFRSWFPFMWRAYEVFGTTTLLGQHIAAFRGHANVLSMFQYRPDFDIMAQDGNGGNALHWASIGGHAQIVRTMLDRGADVNLQKEHGSTALHLASEEGHSHIVQILLENGADVDVRRGNNTTALFIASKEGCTEIVRMLLHKGAKTGSQNIFGKAALHEASEGGFIEIVQMLLDGGADVNVQRRNGSTALHLAIIEGNMEMARVLLRRGADTTLQDHRGFTVLHLAASRDNTEAIKLLLNNGVDINLRNDAGRTPIQYALAQGSPAAVQLLLDKGARVDENDSRLRRFLDHASLPKHHSAIALHREP